MKRYAAAILVLAVIIIAIIYGLQTSNTAMLRQEKNQLKETIEHAIVQCYAMEGRYPESLEELKTVHQIQIDEHKFNVYYEYNGANLMPRVDIIEKE